MRTSIKQLRAARKQPTRVIACLVSLLGIIALGAGVLWPRRPEPTYQSTKLSDWLAQLDYGHWPRGDGVPADEAIRHMGTNVFPEIRRLLRVKDSTLKLRTIALLQKQRFIRLHITPEFLYHHRALAACYALGPVAKPLVPDVAAALDHIHPALVNLAETWLGDLESDAEPAIPALIALLRDKQHPLRQGTALTLVRISRNRWVDVLPVFTELLSDPDQRVKGVALNAFRARGLSTQLPSHGMRVRRDQTL
jgi:hypothetical protein